MPEFTLYYSPWCSACRRVLQHLEERCIEIPMKNTMDDPQSREELIRIGGKSQVPCLVIDGRALYESRDIITWLEKYL